MAGRAKNLLTFSVVVTTTDEVTLEVRLAWQSWGGVIEVAANRAALAQFASEVRDFASHHRTLASLVAGSPGSTELSLTIAEYGRTRKAAVGAALAQPTSPHGTLNWPAALKIQVPTEHGLLGEFGADLAQLLAADSGTASLRLLARWPD